MATNNNTAGLLGVNLTDTPSTNETGIALGTRVSDGNTEYMYVLAGSAISANRGVAVNSTYSAFNITTTLAQRGHYLGWPQQAMASGDYGWIAIRGSISIRVLASCLPFVPLYTSATAGALDDTATTTRALIEGVVILTTAGATATTLTAIATYVRNR